LESEKAVFIDLLCVDLGSRATDLSRKPEMCNKGGKSMQGLQEKDWS